MSIIAGIVGRLLNALFYVTFAALVAMLCIEVGNIIGRPAGLPIPGSVELTSYLGAIFISICILFSTLNHSNVTVQLLTSKLSGRPRALLQAGACLVGIFTALLLSWAGASFAWKMYVDKEKSLILGLPTPAIRYIFVLGLVLVVVALAIDLYRALAKAAMKK